MTDSHYASLSGAPRETPTNIRASESLGEQNSQGAHVVGIPATPDSYWSQQTQPATPADHPQQPQYVYSVAGGQNHDFLNQVSNTANAVGHRTESAIKSLWRHLSPPSSSAKSTALGKLENLQLLIPGHAEKLWRRFLHPSPEERFVNFFSCHVAASGGLVVGTLFVSTLTLGFVSDQPLEYKTPAGTSASSYYLVRVPLVSVADVSRSFVPANPDEKQILIRTVDSCHFCFTNFLSYELATDVVQWAANQAVQLAANHGLPGQQQEKVGSQKYEKPEIGKTVS